MQKQSFRYVIVGAGLSGVSAAEGIREIDRESPILILGRESHLPYDRPPLTKKLWQGKKSIGDIFLHDGPYYQNNGVTLRYGSDVIELDVTAKTIIESTGTQIRYERLLLATGGHPNRMNIPGGDLDGICYYRTLSDYLRIRALAKSGRSVVIIGGGFIGSELASSLRQSGLDVTMIFPEHYICNRIFPDRLGRAVQAEYVRRGVQMIYDDRAVSIEKKDNGFLTRTRNGHEFVSELLIVGIGITPSVELAETAGLRLDNGIVVNERLQTSDPDVYAAGDVACFPYRVLGRSVRLEHWDNSLNQGKLAGRNMAGARETYDHLPYFFSDLFDYGYEAVGEIDPRLPVHEEWEKENEKGVVYFHRSGKIRGVLLWNVWNRVDWARDLIQRGAGITATETPKAA